MNGQETCFNNKDHIAGEFGFRDMYPRAKGVFIHRHVHNYGHLETVVRGSILLTLELPDGIREKVFTQGAAVYIPAGAHHTAEALEAGTLVRCIFHARNAEGEIIKTDGGWDFDPESANCMADDPAFC